MKKRFTEEQIIKILKEHENGKRATDIVREYNIAEQTFYRWKSKFGGMEVSEAKRLKQLEEENRRLKELVADLTLDILCCPLICISLSDRGRIYRPRSQWLLLSGLHNFK